jgi:DNA-binding response OmpR family regulator
MERHDDALSQAAICPINLSELYVRCQAMIGRQAGRSPAGLQSIGDLRERPRRRSWAWREINPARVP